MEQSILAVNGLKVELPAGRGTAGILHGVSFTIKPGEILGLVGESGSGKSVTALAIMQLLPGGAKAVTGGSILLSGQELTHKTPAEMQSIRGQEVSMIFQEPMTSLNPVFTVKQQLVDVIMAHQPLTAAEAVQHALTMLQRVRIADPGRIAASYPHELSGGMRQRVMIAAALACSPALLIADEPTTALDVTIQAQILDLLREAADNTRTAVLFITHDLGVVARLCSQAAVMYAGEIVEIGPVEQILHSPRHPYTQALLAAIPSFTGSKQRLLPIAGTVPTASELPAGCHFYARCPKRHSSCEKQKSALYTIAPEHQVYCRLQGGGQP